MKLGIFLLFLLTSFSAAPLSYGADLRELESAMSKQQWKEAAQIASQLPTASARLQGAYALFQSGYPNSALIGLKKLTQKDWANLPRGQDRMAEIVALFQKKVPLALLPARLDQLDAESSSPYLRNEILFAKGREAFERNDFTTATRHLNAVPKGSRFYGMARYLLGTVAVLQKSHPVAAQEFSRLFESSVFSQSSEFWQDLTAQTTAHWGTNLRVMLETDALTESARVGELGVMALARVAYGSGDFETALTNYSKISAESRLYPSAVLEKVWTLYAMNRHDDSQKLAADFAVSESSFESLQARTMRALVLTDAARTEEARSELKAFEAVYTETKDALRDYEASRIDNALPQFLKNDLKDDGRLQVLFRYQEDLNKEIRALRAEDARTHTVFRTLALELEPLLIQVKNETSKITEAHIARRKKDLERLLHQSRLIRAETYLEDREKLRAEFRTSGEVDLKRQEEHDRRLVELLSQAIHEIDSVIEQSPQNKVRLEFRQSELLWELSTAHGILKNDAEARSVKIRSLKIAEDIVKNHPKFEKHGQAMFFVGFAQVDMDQVDEGYKSLERFVKQYASHVHTPDAYRIMGDIRFDRNQFAAAEDLYKKILAFPDSPIGGYALYKIGWAAYNLKDYSRALLGLEKAILWAKEAADSGHLLSLRREAKHDLISFYAEFGDHKKAFDYFSKFFQEGSAEWLEKLATELDRIGQFDKSADLYRTLIILNPGDPQNISHRASIIHGAYRLRNWNHVLEAAKELIAKHQGGLELPQSEDLPAGKAEKSLRESVLTQQFEFKKSPTPEAMKRVEELDGIYLATFSKWSTIQEPLYRHAFFLLEHGKIDLSVDSFRKHWLQFKDTLTEPLREESLRNLIHALQKMDEGRKAETGDPTELIALCDEYQKSYSESQYSRPIRFLASAILFKYGKMEIGLELAQRLFDQNAGDDIAKRSFKNLKFAYYEKKDWKRAYEWATQMLDKNELGMNAYAQDLKTVREETLFLWADSIPEDNPSAELFMKIASDPEMVRLRDKAQFNSFIRLQKAGRKLEALKIADDLEKSSPGFENLKTIAGLRAAMTQEAGDYERALPMLEAFIKSSDKSIPAESLEQAKKNRDLIQAASAQVNIVAKKTQIPAFSKSTALDGLRKGFETSPLPKAGELAARIKTGAERLEAVAKELLDTSGSSSVPAYHAFEIYCSVPFLYRSYGQAVVKLADSIPGLKEAESAELRTELSKIVQPIEKQGAEFAQQCLDKSADAEHDGPAYRRVHETWGWRADAELSKKVDQVVSVMEKSYPWMDPTEVTTDEAGLLQLHHQAKGNLDTWYALGMARWKSKKVGLARLTWIDALNLDGDDARPGWVMNALAIIDGGSSDQFQKAANEGSSRAWANLAYRHLAGARLQPALNALQKAMDQNAFDESPEIKNLIKELLKR